MSSPNNKTKKKKNPASDEDRERKGHDRGSRSSSDKKGPDKKGPDVSQRTTSGLKAAEHLGKAASGGTLRKGFSLWRASSHLRVAAAGTGDLVKRHPAPAALIGGTVAAAAIFLTVRSMAAADEAAEGEHDTSGDDEPSDEGAEDEESEEQDESGDDAEEEESGEDEDDK